MQRLWKSEVTLWIGGSQDLQQPCEVVDDEATEVAEVSSPSRRRPPQRRESTKLQSATKFLRALRAGKGDAPADGAAPLDRSNPNYHSEGKASRRRAKQAKARAEQTERSHSFHDKASKRGAVADDARRRDSIDSDAMQTDLGGGVDPPPTYENVINGSTSSIGVISAASAGAGGGRDGRDEPTRPLQRDKERRSARKLTKDSGYETSPYSEADYASLSLRSDSAETLTDRLPGGGRPPLQQYLTEEYLIGVDTSRLGGSGIGGGGESVSARRASVSEASEPGSVHSGSTLVPERSGDDGRSSSGGSSSGRVRSPPVGTSSELALACSQSTPALAQHAVTPADMVYNYASDAAPAGWDEERERQAYAAHLRSSSYQLHSRQRSALTAGASESALHARQASGDDDTLSHATFHSTHSLYGKEAARAAAVSAGVGIGVPPYERRASHDALPVEPPPPPPPPPPPMSDAASDVTSLHDGESLTYDLDDIDRALATDVPERDPASLTHIRYGPGHEKYPSWPVPAAAEPESGPPSGGSYRSKSWTDNSELHKDRAPAAGYTRPPHKKSFSATFQQQLNTVMEKCERIGPESFLAPAERESHAAERAKSESPRDDKFPVIDRDGRGPGDKDYNIPSPPERDYEDRFRRAEAPFGAEELGPRSLCTPFLDQLRRDIVMSPVEDGDGGDTAEQSGWSGERTEAESQPRSGRDSVATVVTYSSSNSSNETMRLYGSFSDISVVSSATSRSDPHPDHQIAHSSRVKPPQRLLSENVTTTGAPPPVRHRPEFKLAKSVDESLISGRETDALDGGRDSRDGRERTSPKASRSPAIDYSKPPSVTDRIKALESQSRESRRDLHSKSVPNLLADKWSWRGAGRVDSDSSLPPAEEPRGGASRSGRSLDQTPSDRARPADARARSTDRRLPARSVSSDRCRAPLPGEQPERRRGSQPSQQPQQQQTHQHQQSHQSHHQSHQHQHQHQQQQQQQPQTQQHDSSTLKAIQKQAVMSYYERQMSRAAAPPPSADPKVPEKHERGYRAGPTLWRVPESLQPDSAAAAARPARGSPPVAGRSRGPSRRSSSASDRTTASSSTSSSHSSGRSSSSSQLSGLSHSHSHSHSRGHSRGSSHGSIGEQNIVHSRKITELPGSDSVCSSSLPPAVPTADSEQHASIRTKPSGVSQHVRSSSRDDLPPERPPKKPHLRALSSGAAPQVAAPAHQVLVPAADEPPSPPPSRPPKSPCIRKPAMPEPVRSASPDLPPPPPPPPADETLTFSDEPLPPPPTSMLEVQVSPHGGATRSPSSAQRAPPLSPGGTYHKDSYMAHRRDWKFGYEGRYRRTMSPSPPARGGEPQSPPSPPPPPPPPATASTPAIARSVSYAAPRCEEATTPRLKSAVSAGRLTEGGSKVARQPSTTVVFTDAELRAFRAREQRSKELRAADDADEDKENVREQNGTLLEPVAHPHRQYSLELLNRPAAPTPSPAPASAPVSAPSGQESPPPSLPPLQPTSSAYRSPIAEARNERFAAYKKYSEIKPKSPSSPTETAVPALVTGSFSEPAPAPAPAELPEPAPASPAAPAPSPCRTPASSEVLRLNGQTSPPPPPAGSPPPSPPRTHTLGRRKLPEELECERLSRAFVSQAPVDNKLQNLLVPGPEHRTSAHYIQGLFDLQLTQSVSRKVAPASPAAGPAPALSPTGSPDKSSPETSPLRPDSAYFTTSASKAKFLKQYGRDVTADQSLKHVHNFEQVKRQKEELAARISRKLDILREEQQAVRHEIDTNVTLGAAVSARVEQLAQPAEADKFATYVEQIGTITSLLLGLSGRLARAENALVSLGDQDAEERANLTSKRDKLSDQLEEARKLKLNIDRRSEQVNALLRQYLSGDEYADYQHFIQMKAKLIMDSREIDDKLRLGEEQLAALTQT